MAIKTSSSTESVFSTGYIGKSNAVTKSYTQKAYIKGNSTFWEFVLATFTETHEESYSLQNNLSESIIIHATGAKPIQVTLQGNFTSGKNLDSRMKFLSLYAGDYRPGMLQRTGREVTVYIRDTSFKLIIMSVAVEESVTMEEFTLISISGLAYNYTTTDSGGYINTYFGKASKAYVSSTSSATASTDNSSDSEGEKVPITMVDDADVSISS